jgi:hypothetical protein
VPLIVLGFLVKEVIALQIVFLVVFKYLKYSRFKKLIVITRVYRSHGCVGHFCQALIKLPLLQLTSPAHKREMPLSEMVQPG